MEKKEREALLLGNEIKELRRKREEWEAQTWSEPGGSQVCLDSIYLTPCVLYEIPSTQTNLAVGRLEGGVRGGSGIGFGSMFGLWDNMRCINAYREVFYEDTRKVSREKMMRNIRWRGTAKLVRSGSCQKGFASLERT